MVLTLKLYDFNNTVIDLSENLHDLSGNVASIKCNDTLQDIKLFGHGLQISFNTDSIVAASTLLGTTVTTSGTNTAAIATILATIGTICRRYNT